MSEFVLVRMGGRADRPATGRNQQSISTWARKLTCCWGTSHAAGSIPAWTWKPCPGLRPPNRRTTAGPGPAPGRLADWRYGDGRRPWLGMFDGTTVSRTALGCRSVTSTGPGQGTASPEAGSRCCHLGRAPTPQNRDEHDTRDGTFSDMGNHCPVRGRNGRGVQPLLQNRHRAGAEQGGTAAQACGCGVRQRIGRARGEEPQHRGPHRHDCSRETSRERQADEQG